MRHGNGQNGFTLIEALVVMIVGIVILAAAAAGIGKLYRASEIAEEASNITQMRAQLNELVKYGGSRDITTTALAIQFKIIPSNMTYQGGLVSNVWGGIVTITASQKKARNVSIGYSGVPAEACQQLVLKLANTGWAYININDETIPSVPALKDIGARCAAKGDNNKLTFVTGGASA